MRKYLALIGIALPAATLAQDERLESTITGNQEQPQVLYIVPWQTPDSPTLKYNVARDQSAQVYEHLERSELTRELTLIDPIEAEDSGDDAEQAPEKTDESQPHNKN